MSATPPILELKETPENGRADKTPAPIRLRLLGEAYRRVRAFTTALTEPLTIEDFVVQTMDDVSPTKWHLAHTTWFFEVFLLQQFKPDYRLYHPEFPYLFNSYYVQAGERHCRDRRGYISRPTVSEVFEYRAYVDGRVEELLEEADEAMAARVADVLEIGIHHEQQHQELILTDVKHVLSVNPLRPPYDPSAAEPELNARAVPLEWLHFTEALIEIGHDGEGFCYDNETPRHRHFLQEYLIANRPVTNGEYLEFIDAGGYSRPELWLSEGWTAVQERQWSEPFYWERRDGGWWTYTLGGMRQVRYHEPVCHLSYFEADAFARWADARLPTEFEWERAAGKVPVRGNLVESGRVHPAAARHDGDRNGISALQKMYGDVWEWTRSQYSPYPGYRSLPGALGEYNGKFMCNQFVLRGGSCATSETHIRSTYRNFFPPSATWQFTGLRLARDV